MVDERNMKPDKIEPDPLLSVLDIETDVRNESICIRPIFLYSHSGDQVPDTRTLLPQHRSDKTRVSWAVLAASL